MQTSLKHAITLIITVPLALLFYTLSIKSSNVALKTAKIFEPISNNYPVLVIIAMIPALCIGLTLGQNTKEDQGHFINVIILTSLLLFLLFYNVFSEKNSDLSRILLFGVTLSVLIGWIWSSTDDPYKTIIISVLLAIFFTYAIIRGSTTLFTEKTQRLVSNSGGWVVYFLLVAGLISEVLLITAVYSNDERETSDEVFTWLALAMLIGFTIYAFVEK